MKNQVSWTPNEVSSQSGKRMVITGTGGLGYEAALVLCEHGAQVILAGRNPQKGMAAIEQIKNKVPRAQIEFRRLDLADLRSVEGFAETFKGEPVDVLINNAGVMALPKRESTAEGFEMQMGTNYLGPFALTLHLLSSLRKAKSARVINLASIAHKRGKIHFDDLNWKSSYSSWGAYQQSKLAMLMFSQELQRRSERAQWGLSGMAVHPGVASTELFKNGPQMPALVSKFSEKVFMPLMGHSAAAGAEPMIFAATSELAQGGHYYGPQGLLEMKGPVGEAKCSPYSQRKDLAAKLWDVSEELTGVKAPSV